MCCFLPSSDKSVWGAVYYFFHFLSLLPPHPGQRTKLGFWWQLLSLMWHLYFNLIFSATQQRLNHSSARLERGWTERDSLEAEVFYLLADGSSIETGYWFFFELPPIWGLCSPRMHIRVRRATQTDDVISLWYVFLVQPSSISTLRDTGKPI